MNSGYVGPPAVNVGADPILILSVRGLVCNFLGMNVVAHGFDLVECARITEILERYEERFCARVLTGPERENARRFKHPVPHIAGRFAAKEAILKLLGTGWRGRIRWTDMEILNDSAGQPHVTLTGECARVAARLGIARVLISITHTRHHAGASAIGISAAV